MFAFRRTSFLVHGKSFALEFAPLGNKNQLVTKIDEVANKINKIKYSMKMFGESQSITRGRLQFKRRPPTAGGTETHVDIEWNFWLGIWNSTLWINKIMIKYYCDVKYDSNLFQFTVSFCSNTVCLSTTRYQCTSSWWIPVHCQDGCVTSMTISKYRNDGAICGDVCWSTKEEDEKEKKKVKKKRIDLARDVSKESRE